MSNVATVQAIYEAFGTGNMPGIFVHLHDDIDWEPGLVEQGIPWLRAGHGLTHVQSFFEAVGTNLEFQKFAPTTFFESGNQVAVVLDVEATVRSTGKRILDNAEVHLWTFDDRGKVIALRHAVDTAQHIAALHA